MAQCSSCLCCLPRTGSTGAYILPSRLRKCASIGEGDFYPLPTSIAHCGVQEGAVIPPGTTFKGAFLGTTVLVVKLCPTGVCCKIQSRETGGLLGGLGLQRLLFQLCSVPHSHAFCISSMLNHQTIKKKSEISFVWSQQTDPQLLSSLAT